MALSIRHVILDRDGVLNVEQAEGAWVSDWSQWVWLPGAREGLRVLSAVGMRISIVTNQSGVGRGLVGRSDLDAVHAKMVEEAGQEGGRIHQVFVCPHAPGDACACRKPQPGLFVKAIDAAGVPAHETIAIGDDLRDLQAAWSAGVTAAIVRTGKGHRTESIVTGQEVPAYNDLREFAAAILADSVPLATQNILIARRIFLEHRSVVREAATRLPRRIEQIAEVLQKCLASGKKILACGNGGSAATAQHFVAELVGRFRYDRRALPAIALTADTMVLTALANDYGYEGVFARQVEALGSPGDVLLAFSTSGSSPNIVEAGRMARTKGCTVIAFTGEQRGSLAAHADVLLNVPSKDVARIQEVHDICIHALAEAVEVGLCRIDRP